MPNRIIKESITTSEKLASLSDFEFRLWIGLITQADDAGRGDARPAVIKGRVFPFRERLTVKDVGSSLRALADKGCVTLYEIGGRPYFYFPNWSKHQRVRDCKPKYPEPTEDSLRQVAADCGEARQSAAIIQSNTIQSESESNPNPTPNPYADTRDGERPDFGTLEAYASSNLRNLSPGNMQQLVSFRDDLPDEVIRLAIDQACGSNAPSWNYVRKVLNNWLEKGVKTEADAKAEIARGKPKEEKPGREREYNWAR